jgi:glycosyltransferase involved in cell wall biosynthesis
VSDRAPVVDAILVTFGRADSVIEVCRSALAQSTGLRTLLVVDNNETPRAADLVGELASGTATDVRVLHPGRNLGPAGGIAAGFRELQRIAEPLEWVLMLDDDDPLPATDVVERELEALCSLGEDQSGGVALMGARFSPPLLLATPIDPRPGGLIPVDSLHGWAAPIYRAEALEEVGGFRPELFWGLEELDTGLRMGRSGWRLYVAADVFLALPTPGKQVARPGRPRARATDPSPRDYYRLRNSVDIGRRYFRRRHLALAIAVRAILKPLATLPLRPRVAIRALRQNVRAVVDGLRGDLGPKLSLRD